MADYEFCSVERDGHLLIVTMNRPDRMNSLHPPANFELEKVFNDFAADPDLWVAIITGAGDRAFSAGNDLKYQAEGNKLEVPATGFAGLTARYDLNKPVIAAVNGVAMGGGFEIAAGALAFEGEATGAQAVEHAGVIGEMVGLAPDRAVPCQPEPGEIVVDLLLPVQPAAGLVEIVDAQQEAATAVAGHVMGQQGGIGVSEMQGAGWGRGKSCRECHVFSTI